MIVAVAVIGEEIVGIRCWSDASAKTRLEGGDRYGDLLSLIQE